MKKRNLESEESIAPDEQECRIIILQVILQAVKDYEYFRNKTDPEDLEIFYTAEGFIFDDNYVVDWGGIDMNLAKFCDYIDVDIDWVRNQIIKKLDLEWRPTQGILIPAKEF